VANRPPAFLAVFCPAASHAAGHIRAALDRWNLTPFHRAHDKERARLIIVHAASRIGVPLPEGDGAREAV